MTVGDWITSSAAASLGTHYFLQKLNQLHNNDPFDPKTPFYILFQKLHKRASAADRKAKDLLLNIVSGMKVTKDDEEKWNGVPGYSLLWASRNLIKTF
jgi:hypothetical protein